MWTFISTNLRMQPVGERAFPSHTQAAKLTHITKYAVSSEAQAVPTASGATSASTRLGQPVPAQDGSRQQDTGCIVPRAGD